MTNGDDPASIQAVPKSTVESRPGLPVPVHDISTRDLKAKSDTASATAKADEGLGSAPSSKAELGKEVVAPEISPPIPYVSAVWDGICAVRHYSGWALLALVLVIILYGSLRMAGLDPLLPAVTWGDDWLKKMRPAKQESSSPATAPTLVGSPEVSPAGTAIAKALDISGEWKYHCVGDLSSTPYIYKDQVVKSYEHGGVCQIDVNPTEFGIEWRLYGQRMWVNWTDSHGSFHKDRLSPAVNWQTDWGVMTARDALKFTYRVETSEGPVLGFGWATVSGTNNRGESIEGSFYQLPPRKTIYGTMEFRRRTSPTDVDWPSASGNP